MWADALKKEIDKRKDKVSQRIKKQQQKFKDNGVFSEEINKIRVQNAHRIALSKIPFELMKHEVVSQMKNQQSSPRRSDKIAHSFPEDENLDKPNAPYRLSNANHQAFLTEIDNITSNSHPQNHSNRQSLSSPNSTLNPKNFGGSKSPPGTRSHTTVPFDQNLQKSPSQLNRSLASAGPAITQSKNTPISKKNSKNDETGTRQPISLLSGLRSNDIASNPKKQVRIAEENSPSPSEQSSENDDNSKKQLIKNNIANNFEKLPLGALERLSLEALENILSAKQKTVAKMEKKKIDSADRRKVGKRVNANTNANQNQQKSEEQLLKERIFKEMSTPIKDLMPKVNYAFSSLLEKQLEVEERTEFLKKQEKEEKKYKIAPIYNPGIDPEFMVDGVDSTLTTLPSPSNNNSYKNGMTTFFHDIDDELRNKIGPRGTPKKLSEKVQNAQIEEKKRFENQKTQKQLEKEFVKSISPLFKSMKKRTPLVVTLKMKQKIKAERARSVEKMMKDPKNVNASFSIPNTKNVAEELFELTDKSTAKEVYRKLQEKMPIFPKAEEKEETKENDVEVDYPSLLNDSLKVNNIDANDIISFLEIENLDKEQNPQKRRDLLVKLEKKKALEVELRQKEEETKLREKFILSKSQVLQTDLFEYERKTLEEQKSLYFNDVTPRDSSTIEDFLFHFSSNKQFSQVLESESNLKGMEGETSVFSLETFRQLIRERTEIVSKLDTPKGEGERHTLFLKNKQKDSLKKHILFGNFQQEVDYQELMNEKSPEFVAKQRERDRKNRELVRILERTISDLCLAFHKRNNSHTISDAFKNIDTDALLTDSTEKSHYFFMLKDILLSVLQIVEFLRDSRSKRSWLKGAEVFFLWELKLSAPFRVDDEKHLRLLAVHFVRIYENNHKAILELLKSGKNKFAKSGAEASEIEKILEGRLRDYDYEKNELKELKNSPKRERSPNSSPTKSDYSPLKDKTPSPVKRSNSPIKAVAEEEEEEELKNLEIGNIEKEELRKKAVERKKEELKQKKAEREKNESTLRHWKQVVLGELSKEFKSMARFEQIDIVYEYLKDECKILYPRQKTPNYMDGETTEDLVDTPRPPTKNPEKNSTAAKIEYDVEKLHKFQASLTQDFEKYKIIKNKKLLSTIATYIAVCTPKIKAKIIRFIRLEKRRIDTVTQLQKITQKKFENAVKKFQYEVVVNNALEGRQDHVGSQNVGIPLYTPDYDNDSSDSDTSKEYVAGIGYMTPIRGSLLDRSSAAKHGPINVVARALTEQQQITHPQMVSHHSAVKLKIAEKQAKELLDKHNITQYVSQIVDPVFQKNFLDSVLESPRVLRFEGDDSEKIVEENQTKHKSKRKSLQQQQIDDLKHEFLKKVQDYAYDSEDSEESAESDQEDEQSLIKEASKPKIKGTFKLDTKNLSNFNEEARNIYENSKNKKKRVAEAKELIKETARKMDEFFETLKDKDVLLANRNNNTKIDVESIRLRLFAEQIAKEQIKTAREQTKEKEKEDTSRRIQKDEELSNSHKNLEEKDLENWKTLGFTTSNNFYTKYRNEVLEKRTQESQKQREFVEQQFKLENDRKNIYVAPQNPEETKNSFEVKKFTETLKERRSKTSLLHIPESKVKISVSSPPPPPSQHSGRVSFSQHSERASFSQNSERASFSLMSDDDEALDPLLGKARRKSKIAKEIVQNIVLDSQMAPSEEKEKERARAEKERIQKEREYNTFDLFGDEIKDFRIKNYSRDDCIKVLLDIWENRLELNVENVQRLFDFHSKRVYVDELQNLVMIYKRISSLMIEKGNLLVNDEVIEQKKGKTYETDHAIDSKHFSAMKNVMGINSKIEILLDKLKREYQDDIAFEAFEFVHQDVSSPDTTPR